MELRDKVGQLPFSPGVYLYKDAGGRVIYVGKAKSLRNRVRSYFSEDKLADVKTGTLIGEACDIDYILVDNEKEALALENNLIKQYKPRFNILLRDDKTYPYIKLTNEKYPRVYVTRRLRKDGATYFGPYFPANLAHRLVHFIHRHFQVPSCKVDLTRFHPKPCLQFHIHRCLGPCVKGLTTDEAYAAAVRDVRLFLEGRHNDLARGMRVRMEAASLGDALRGSRRAARPDHHRGRDRRAPEDGRGQGRRRRYLRRLRRAAAGGAQPVPPAQRPDCGSPRVLLGRPVGVRRARVSSARCSSRSTWTSSSSRPRSTCRWSSKIARRWRNCSAKSATARWRSARRSAARRRRCWDWWRPTPSTVSTRASAC